MSGYQERAGPNVSQYLQNLNTIPAPYDDDFGSTEFLADDLAMFANANFTDFDTSLPDDLLAGTDALDAFEPSPVDVAPRQPLSVYSYPTPIQPAPPAKGVALNSYDSSLIPSPSSLQAAPAKRKAESAASAASPALSVDEKSRLAAEEDKRRRNTAASARFRVKKKQREQTLEKTVKEISEKNSNLEAKLSQLETENKWLKNLITEKNGKQSKEEMAAAYQKYRKESEEREEQVSTR